MNNMILKYLLIFLSLFLTISCSRNINLENGFVQYLDDNKNRIVFYIVNDEATMDFWKTYSQLSNNEIFDENGNLIIDYKVPENNMLMGFFNIKDNWEETFFRYLIIHEDVIHIGNYFYKMEKKLIENDILLTFYLDSIGNNLFKELTSNNINNSLAIAIDNKIIVNPRILRTLENSVNFYIGQ